MRRNSRRCSPWLWRPALAWETWRYCHRSPFGDGGSSPVRFSSGTARSMAARTIPCNAKHGFGRECIHSIDERKARRRLLRRGKAFAHRPQQIVLVTLPGPEPRAVRPADQRHPAARARREAEEQTAIDIMPGAGSGFVRVWNPQATASSMPSRRSSVGSAARLRRPGLCPGPAGAERPQTPIFRREFNYSIEPSGWRTDPSTATGHA